MSGEATLFRDFMHWLSQQPGSTPYGEFGYWIGKYLARGEAQ